MNIIPARSFTPDYFLGVGFKGSEADGTVTVDGFAFAGVVGFGCGSVFGVCGGGGEDLVKFLFDNVSNVFG